jgi:cation transport regulator ChaB
MPYSSKSDLPPNVKQLSSHLQDIWMAAFNSAWKTYNGDEEKCFAIAWGAVNKARGTAKASLQYYPKIEAKAIDGKRFIWVEVLDSRVSRPLSEPYGLRWKVDGESLRRSAETVTGTVLMGPIASLDLGHEIKRPVARFVSHEMRDGALLAKYALIEDDHEWAEHAWSQIQAGNWKYVSAHADFDYNYPIDQEGDIIYPHRFKLDTVDIVAFGAFPTSQVFHTFSEGLAASLAEFSQARPSKDGFDQKPTEKKKMSEDKLVEMQAQHTKELSDIQAKLDKAEKDLALERERVVVLNKKTESVEARTLEAVSKELDTAQKRIADLEKGEQEKKDKEKLTLATEVAELKVDNGLILPKDAVVEAERLKTFDEPALLELKASLADLSTGRRYMPKTLPNSISLKATVDPKERRRMELYGEYVNDKGEFVTV